MSEKEGKKDRIIGYRVDEDLFLTFKAVCEKEGKAMSKVVRNLIRDYIKSRLDKPTLM